MDRPSLAGNKRYRNNDVKLLNNELLFLSAKAGQGKSYYLKHSEVLRYSHQLKYDLSSFHNSSENFWQGFIEQCQENTWIKPSFQFNVAEAGVKCFRDLAVKFNKYSQCYAPDSGLFLVFDNSHIIDNLELLSQLSYFISQLGTSITCVFSGRNNYLYEFINYETRKKSDCLTDSDFLLSSDEFKEILLKQHEVFCNENNRVVDELHYLVNGHLGLGLLCIDTAFIKTLVDSNRKILNADVSLKLIQAPEIHAYFNKLIEPLSAQEEMILSLPLLNRSLITKINSVYGMNKGLEYYIERSHLFSSDQVDYILAPLFRDWLNINLKRANDNLLRLAIEYYHKQNDWPQAVACAVLLENREFAIELILHAAREFSRKGKNQEARELIGQLPIEKLKEKSKKNLKEQQEELMLALFENLLDFHQYGHQIASKRLEQVLADFSDVSSNDQCHELLVLLKHHYSLLTHPQQEMTNELSISNYDELFLSKHELSAWAWHGLAMEQILAGHHQAGLESALKAIHWSVEHGDAPCALASLAWIIVPSLHLGKLSSVLNYCNQVEGFLKKSHINDIAMAGIIHRVRILVYREQGEFHKAFQELPLMQRFYENLDPLNLAYCYWAEFVLSLSAKNIEQARNNLSCLETHVAMHLDGWQLALPNVELLSAVLDTLSGSELAMLDWASQFQLTHINDRGLWLTDNYPPFQSEIIAYIRVRITLGSDMSSICSQLLERGEEKGDRLLIMHSLILSFLNAHRQEDEHLITRFRHYLLNKAGIFEFQQLYREYLDELIPLLINYQALPSELAGYEKVMPSIESISGNKKTDSTKNSKGISELSREVDMLESDLFLALTSREQQIALLVLDGLTNKQISERLSIGVATVKGHVSNIYNKLGIQRRTQLTSLLMNSGS